MIHERRRSPLNLSSRSLIRNALGCGLTWLLTAAPAAMLVAVLATTSTAPSAAQTPDTEKTSAAAAMSPDQQTALSNALRTIAPGLGKDVQSVEILDIDPVLADLTGLSEAQREDLAAYYHDVLSRAWDGAATPLDYADRSALTAFHDYIRGQGVTPPDAGPGPKTAASSPAAPAPGKAAARPPAPAGSSSPSPMARPAAPPSPNPAPAVSPPAQAASPDTRAAPEPGAADAPSITPEMAKQFQDNLTKQALDEQARTVRRQHCASTAGPNRKAVDSVTG